MGLKRITRITLETERIFVIRSRGGAVEQWCEGCGEKALMVTPEEAAVRAGLSRRAIYRLVEAGELHFTEASDAMLLICLNSLLK